MCGVRHTHGDGGWNNWNFQVELMTFYFDSDQVSKHKAELTVIRSTVARQPQSINVHISCLPADLVELANTQCFIVIV